MSCGFDLMPITVSMIPNGILILTVFTNTGSCFLTRGSGGKKLVYYKSWKDGEFFLLRVNKS